MIVLYFLPQHNYNLLFTNITNMKKILLLLLGFVISTVLEANDTVQHRVYLLPGQGSDQRIFNKLNLEGFDTIHLRYLIPEKNETMTQFAARMLEQVDTTGSYSFVGVSLGGMIAVEMAKISHPAHVIIISSAKNQYELPVKYRIMRTVPIHKLFNGRTIRVLGLVFQPIVEPDSMRERPTFKAMMKAKDALLLERGIDMIIHWQHTTEDQRVIHLHGTRDHTIPFRRVKNAVVVKKGSHMMTLTRGEEIGKMIAMYLSGS